MGRPRAKSPIKFCLNCGKQLLLRTLADGSLEQTCFLRARKYCNRKCMALGMEGTMKTSTPRSHHRQSRKAVKEKCQNCGRRNTKLHVHHADSNPMNNDPSNFRTLCGSCHRRCHSPNYEATGLRRKPCKICGNPSMRTGLCYKHVTRQRLYGDPCLTKRRQGLKFVLVRDNG